MKAFRLALIALACPVAVFSQTAAPATQRPATPQVTVGADIKLLRFDWEPVARAAYYQLMVKPGRSSRYHAAGDRIPASETRVDLPIPVHLQYWADTRYLLRACNSAGCTNSAVINPQSQMLDTIGYLKASNPNVNDRFGLDVALSADGYTLVVNALSEASKATGVNGNQADNSSPESGAVYVFRRRTNTWHQEAYLKAGVNQPLQSFGTGFFGHRVIAISGDGNMLAVGAPRQIINGVRDAGVVYVFRRTRNVWRLLTTLRSPTPQQSDYFGYQLDMSQDGRTLSVTGTRPIADEEGNFGARTYIFVRPGSAWQHSVTLTPELPDDLCHTVRLSGDGNTLVASCASYTRPNGSFAFVVTRKRNGNAWPIVSEFSRESGFRSRQPLALNYDATRMAMEEGGIPPAVGVYRWEAGAWVREAGLIGPSLDTNGALGFGFSLAFNDEGTLLAVGDLRSEETGMGVYNTPAPGSETRGAAFLYRPGNAGEEPWVLRAVVASPVLGIEDSFGVSVALSGSGRTLAVGAYAEDGAARGIDGDREDDSRPETGAVFLY